MNVFDYAFDVFGPFYSGIYFYFSVATEMCF
jgi:hypothetical protein